MPKHRFLSALWGNLQQEESCPYAKGWKEGICRVWHYSQVMEKHPPICGARDCRDGDKMLCNRCPLKHEVRERGRGEMLYENAFDQNTNVGKPASTNTTDTSNIWHVAWAQPSIREYINNEIRGMDTTIWQQGSINRLGYGCSHPIKGVIQ